MGRSRFLICIFKRYMAILACSVTCFLACRKETRFGENSSLVFVFVNNFKNCLVKFKTKFFSFSGSEYDDYRFGFVNR